MARTKARERRKWQGEYRVRRVGAANKVVTLPASLDGEKFPVEVGDEVEIEQVEDRETGETRVEIRPVRAD